MCSTLAVIVYGLASGLAACAIQAPAPANPPSAEAPVVMEPSPPAPASPVPAGVAAAPASPSPAQAAAAAGVMLHSAANQAYCIDAAQDHSAKRIPVRLFTCHGGENQRWILTPDPNGVTAVAGILGQCLDIKGAHAADGTNAHMDPCTGGASQQFTYDAAGHLRDQTTGKCLTVTKEARGAPIIIEPCDPGNPGQVWSTAER